MFVGGIEGGGTTFVLTVAKDSPVNVVETFEFATTSPEPTLDKAIEWFGKYPLSALGVAMFGPLDLKPTSLTFGALKATPKVKWRGFDVLGYLKQRLVGLPIRLQSDVNAAALAELRHGEHGGITSCCYITVGTGVGVGICLNSMPVVGHSHPEAGHVYVRRHPTDPPSLFAGVCSFHGDCIEGLCSAGAIATRTGLDASQLVSIADHDPVWDIVGWYLGELCAHLTLTCSPEVIVLGGGVLKRQNLFDIARKRCSEALGAYVALPCPLDDYIVPTKLAVGAGVVGALTLGFDQVSTR